MMRYVFKRVSWIKVFVRYRIINDAFTYVVYHSWIRRYPLLFYCLQDLVQ